MCVVGLGLQTGGVVMCCIQRSMHTLNATHHHPTRLLTQCHHTHCLTLLV